MKKHCWQEGVSCRNTFSNVLVRTQLLRRFSSNVLFRLNGFPNDSLLHCWPMAPTQIICQLCPHAASSLRCHLAIFSLVSSLLVAFTQLFLWPIWCCLVWWDILPTIICIYDVLQFSFGSLLVMFSMALSMFFHCQLPPLLFGEGPHCSLPLLVKWLSVMFLFKHTGILFSIKKLLYSPNHLHADEILWSISFFIPWYWHSYQILCHLFEFSSCHNSFSFMFSCCT